MTCASCANRVERRLNDLPGVDASVNFATERATVAFDPAEVAPARLVEEVAATGYTATLPAEDGERRTGRAETTPPTRSHAPCASAC